MAERVEPNLSWRVWVHVRGKPYIRALAHVTGVCSANQARELVVNRWTARDWDSEAFGYADKRGLWRYYQLRPHDRVVVCREARMSESNGRLYLTLYKDGHVLPDGFVTELPLEARDSPAESHARLVLAVEALGSLAINEASFTHSRPKGRAAAEGGYLEVS